jgi:hypothetical protein
VNASPVALSQTLPNLAVVPRTHLHVEVLRRPLDSARRAAVGVVHDSSVWPPALEGHDEGVGDELGVRGGAHGPADDPPGPQIDDRGQV